jgi:four helix bundle protein
MTASHFEDLMVFRRAYQISLEVHRISLQFPRVEQFGLAEQIRRASKSICANVAEGFGKQDRGGGEFRRCLRIAARSADEMQVWAQYCVDLGYVEATTGRRWRDEYQQIARMLQGLHRTSLRVVPSSSDP